MRAVFLACITALGLVSQPAFAGSQKRIAQVELLSFSAAAITPSVVDRGLSADDTGAGEGGRSSIPADFRTHDLSRKFVEFRMAGELNASSPSSLTPPSPGETSPPIAIPDWMRFGQPPSVSPIPMAGTCGSTLYRPSGFLSRAAEYRRAGMFQVMSDIACQYGIPVGLFDAMIIRESRYQTNIFSPKNAFGLTQLLPGTAADLGVNRFDPVENLRGGARYLRDQIDRFGQVHLALAAYNAGPSRVRGGQIPAIAETRNYVADILMNWRRLTDHRQVRMTDFTTPSPTRPSASRAGYRVAVVSLF